MRVMLMCLGYMMVTWLLFFFNVGKFQQGLPKKRKGFHCTDDLLLGSRRFDPQRNRSFSLPRTPKVVRGFFRLRIHRCVFLEVFFWVEVCQVIQFDSYFSNGLVQPPTSPI